MPPTQHLFLCAIGRSGTTIFRTSLGLHPDIYYNNHENNIIQDLMQVANDNCTRTSRKFAMVVDQNEYDRIFRKAITDLIWPDEDLRARDVHMAAINPVGSQLDYLCQVFPGSRIICLVRNGIEVISSRMRFDSFSSHSFESHCQVWLRSQSVYQWGQSNPSDFRVFRHEWFYDEFTIRAQLSAFSGWLEIGFADEPANNILNQLRHPTESSVEVESEFNSMSGDAKAAYFRSKSDRWKDWSESQRLTFNELCGEFMSELGYPIPWRDN